MSEPVTLQDYERAEKSVALKDAWRGLVIHGTIALFSVLGHFLLVLRARKSVERRQERIERTAIEERQAA